MDGTEAKVIPVEARRKSLAASGGGADSNPATRVAVVEQRNAFSAAGSDGLRFSHRQRVLTIPGMEKFGAVNIGSFLRCTMEQSDTPPPQVWSLSLRSSPIALGDKCRLSCIESTMRRTVAVAAAVR